MKDKHYFFDPFNLLIEISCFSNIVFCILVTNQVLNNYISIYANILSIIGNTIIIFIFKQFFNINSPKSNENFHEKYTELEVTRIDWLKNVKSHKGIFLLYGESGVGKTYLLNQFIDSLEKEEESYSYIENNYFSSIESFEEALLTSNYIIFDQFEKALQDKNIYNLIKHIKNKKNDKHIIISFRKEYLEDIFHLFLDDNLNLIRLYINKTELNLIKNNLQSIAGCSPYELSNINLYSRLLNDIESEEISFIQLAYICKEIQYKNEIYVQEKLNILDDNYNLVIEDYLKDELNNYKYSQFAYQILYLLCLDPKGILIHDVIDFQNICIQPLETIKKIVDFLFEQKWIRRVKNSNNIRSFSTEQYEISHDFFIDRFSNICREQLNEEIKSNIEYYNITFQAHRNIKVDKKEKVNELKQMISKKCEDFINSKLKTIINVCLCVILLWVVLANIITLSSKESITMEECLTQILLNLIVNMSIYYIYNYALHFLRFFKTYCSIVIIVGLIFCIAPFWLKKYWALPMGFAILITGIIMACISTKIISKEKTFFVKRAWIFSAIGIIVMILSYYFYIYTEGKFFRALPLYLLTIVYMGLTIWGHIDKTYLHGILGKVLYGQKYEKTTNQYNVTES
ncbi:MAG: P-loop NTPase fold protein [Bacteroides sp.]|nr:P-loop NTPase fold protein [Bacteroides sp.]MCM1549660.1 P-loop NTPase fold protein [Clostridium sp.]